MLPAAFSTRASLATVLPSSLAALSGGRNELSLPRMEHVVVILVDGLGALHSDRAELTFTTPNRPALIKPADAEGNVVPGYLYLLMPVRLPG